MKNSTYFQLIILLMFALPSQANLITVADDNADNYGSQWVGNGGYGFTDWHFNIDSANGHAGGFLANTPNNNDLNHIASNVSNQSWGSYANGANFNQFEAYRGFANNSLINTGDRFNVAIEHGNIEQGGAAGFVLRNQNIHHNIGDYNQNSRFEFGFIGGASTYSIFDGYGVINTGIDFRTSGLNLSFSLLSSDLYQLDIFDAINNNLLQSRNGLLKGVGSIDSVSLYNRNAEHSNVYFNNLSISKTIITSVSEPSPISVLALILLFSYFLHRKLLT